MVERWTNCIMKKDILLLVQTNGIDYRHVSKMWDAGKKYASVAEAIVVPFSEALDNEFDAGNLYVIPYGSVRLSRIGLKEGWEGIFVNDNFDNATWVKNRDDMLNQDVEICTIAELGAYKNEKVFLRPAQDNKSFRAGIYDGNDIDQLIEAASMGENHGYGTSSRVVISSPKTLHHEHRYFIVGGKVISGSLYALNGVPLSAPVTHESMITKAQEMADVWLPHETCVMDLTDVGGDEFKVVEFNAFNSSGFYEHDIDAIVKAVVNTYGEDNEKSKSASIQERYYDNHKRCPNCGNTKLSQTYVGFIIQSPHDTDTNKVTCKCGWTGIVHDLVEDKNLLADITHKIVWNEIVKEMFGDKK